MIAGTYDPNGVGRTVVVIPPSRADTLRDHKGSALEPRSARTCSLAFDLRRNQLLRSWRGGPDAGGGIDQIIVS
jgi:hypothetical protein